MEIRLATPDDVSEIVTVLRQSLGESKLPKSAEIWNYKHTENPFGKSLILLAVLDGKIVGVRAFMRWTWQYGKDKFSSLRAVDTATLPEYQGRGIFKKLTLKAVEIASENGDHLVFNTPNSQSMPGYLKMGWNKVDRLMLELTPCNPFNWKRSENINYQKSDLPSPEQLHHLTNSFNQLQEGNGLLFTPKSFDYLVWRYYKNPLQDYQIVAEKDFFVSGYLKPHKFGKELRITEAVFVDKVSKKKMKREINDWAKTFGVHVISKACSPEYISSVSLRGKFGPVLTLKNLNLNKSLNSDFKNIRNWGYSLGDLELF